MSTVESMSAAERFLQYVAFDTQSVRDSATAPSAATDLELAADREGALRALGVENPMRRAQTQSAGACATRAAT